MAGTLFTPVRLGTTQNLTLSSAIDIGNEKIDGVIVTSGMRILVKAQTTRAENGIYVVGVDGMLTRATDFALGATIDCDSTVFIQEGTLLQNTGWVVNRFDEVADTTFVVGTNPIVWQRFTVNLNLDAADIASAIVLRSVKGYPLTIAELDNNFKWISTTLNQKLNSSDFTALKITEKINSLSAAEANIDAWKLRGLSARTDVTVSYQGPAGDATIPIRDELGDIYANRFHGNLLGNADTADLADYATLSHNVDGIIAVVNGGTGADDHAEARVNLRALGIDGNEAMLGKLVLPASTNVRASLNIPPSINPTTPIDGDIWTTTTSIRYKLNNSIHSVAPLDSPTFTGTPNAPTASKTVNTTQIASTAFVQLHVTDINDALDLKAPIASPTFTGEPSAPTPATSDNSTKIATTAFVVNKLAQYDDDYYTKSQIDLMHNSIAQSRSDGDANLQNQLNILKQQTGIPVGSIVYYAANSIPLGYLLCDGRMVSKTTYPILWQKLGSTYGESGDNFRLPDLRGEFIRGFDAGREVDSGRVFGSWQKGSLIGYDENADAVWALSTTQDGLTSPAVLGMDAYPGQSYYTNARLTGVGNTNSINLTTNGASAGWVGVSRPRNVAMLACIKAFGDVDDPDQINAANVLQTILNKVNRDGDTMTGPLALYADPTATMHAVTKQYVDNRQDMWGTSKKFVQSTEPLTAVDGDFWFKVS